MDRSMFAERSPSKGVYFEQLEQQRYYQHLQKNKHVHQQRPPSPPKSRCRFFYHRHWRCLIWIPPSSSGGPFCTGWNPIAGSLLPLAPCSAFWNLHDVQIKGGLGGGKERDKCIFKEWRITEIRNSSNRSFIQKKRLFLFVWLYFLIVCACISVYKKLTKVRRWHKCHQIGHYWISPNAPG